MVSITCKQCGKEFSVKPSREHRARFCSRGCYSQSRSKSMQGKNHPCWVAKIKKVCKQCAIQFTVPPSLNRIKFCSQKCYWAWQVGNTAGKNATRWDGGGTGHHCKWCGEMFIVGKSVALKGEGKFCTRDCYGKWQSQNQRGAQSPSWKDKIVKICLECEIEFRVIPSRAGRKFCSRECLGQWRSQHIRGETSYSWRGGTSFEPYGVEFNKARKEAIRGRDGYTCAICKLDGIVVHHIDYDKQNNDPQNLLTLCRSCHGTTGQNREYWQRALSPLPSLHESEILCATTG